MVRDGGLGEVEQRDELADADLAGVLAQHVDELQPELGDDLFFKLGDAMNAKGQWNGLSVYALMAYVVSGLPDGVESRDRMVLLSGLSLPLAPWKR